MDGGGNSPTITMFDWTLNVGQVINIGAILVTLTGIYWKLRSDLVVFSVRLANVADEIQLLRKVIVDLAVQSQRLDNMEKFLYKRKIKNV